MQKYDKRGVSADKQDVHKAIENLDKGLFSDTFCKLLPDYITGNDQYAIAMHADTAGTKTSLAYLWWKETGDYSVWEGIVQDALIMNIDDLACVGATNNIVISSTIGRNKYLIDGEVISTLINSSQRLAERLTALGCNIYLAGGETADVGDIVRTIDVGFTAFARLKKSEIIHINIQPGDVIVGFESYGQSSYENDYNSGIGSNGLTFARHESLAKNYKHKYPESFASQIPDEYVYSGKLNLNDPSPVEGKKVGQLLLSPTRTYLPVINEIIAKFHDSIHGMIHCTGGGQTKVLHFIDKLKITKDNLFEIPPVFQLIQQQTGTDWNEMFKVFNMGHRLEIYLNPKDAEKIIQIAAKYNIRAKIIGFCESSETKSVVVRHDRTDYLYT